MRDGGRLLGELDLGREHHRHQQAPLITSVANRIAVFDVTGNWKYLSTAQAIFADMHKAYGTTPCGGLWWDKPNTYVNAIANELYISVAAHLAVRSRDGSQRYLDRAKEAWDWFQKSGMINDQWNINDGLDNTTCKNNGKTVW